MSHSSFLNHGLAVSVLEYIDNIQNRIIIHAKLTPLQPPLQRRRYLPLQYPSQRCITPLYRNTPCFFDLQVTIDITSPQLGALLPVCRDSRLRQLRSILLRDDRIHRASNFLFLLRYKNGCDFPARLARKDPAERRVVEACLDLRDGVVLSGVLGGDDRVYWDGRVLDWLWHEWYLDGSDFFTELPREYPAERRVVVARFDLCNSLLLGLLFGREARGAV